MSGFTIADLNPHVLLKLLGLSRRRPLIDPRDAGAMSRHVRVTFRPYRGRLVSRELQEFCGALEDALLRCGAEVMTWPDAIHNGVHTNGEKKRSRRRVRRSVQAVIDIERARTPMARVLSSIAEMGYAARRSPEMSITEILHRSGWAENFTARHLQDPFNTQIVTITRLNREFVDREVPYDQKIGLGMNDLIRTMSEIVIGVGDDLCSIVNMNLSDSVFSKSDLDAFVRDSLLPKIYVPVRPPGIGTFRLSEDDFSQSPYTVGLVELGCRLRATGLFPGGATLSERIRRRSHRDVVERILEGRTGVSYGFIAYCEPPRYEGPKMLSRREWSALPPAPDSPEGGIRVDRRGRWYVQTYSNDDESYQQVPDLWVVTSRSGCDKTSLDPVRDVVRIGVTNGELRLQTVPGADLSRRDIRPSFDTQVILAQALAAAWYAPRCIEDGMPIVHFHGYPSPDWFKPDESFGGARNPSVPCGTAEAAMLNFWEISRLSREADSASQLYCVVEPDHGVNVIAGDSQYLAERLSDGAGQGQIVLGGRYLPELRQSPSDRLARLSA